MFHKFFVNVSDFYSQASKHSSRWRRIEDVSRLWLQQMSSRCPQDILIKIYLPWPYVFKSFWSRRVFLPWAYVFRRHLQDVLIKTNIFGLIIRLQDVLKTFSRCLQDVLLTRLQEVLRLTAKANIYRKIHLSHSSWEI